MAFYKVTKRTKADGTPRYLCSVQVKEQGKLVYNKSRTFSKEKAAVAYGKKRVLEIEENGYNDDNSSGVLVRELIQKLLDDKFIQLGRTKRSVLKMLCDCDIGNIDITKLASHHVIEHCKDRASTNVMPQTISHDVSYLRWSLKQAKPMFGYNVNDDCIVQAYDSLHSLKLIGKSNRRSRRPTSVEIDKILAGLEKREHHKYTSIPYTDLFNFAILTCMRVGEVCSILWQDVDVEQRAVIVRDRKDPRKKVGNHMLVPLLGEAWDILQRQPRRDERVFPHNSKSVSRGFQEVRKSLGIKDLRYHDLRREGASRLFEQGFAIDEVAQVTGHRNINTLWQIYTELYPNRLHDKFRQ